MRHSKKAVESTAEPGKSKQHAIAKAQALSKLLNYQLINRNTIEKMVYTKCN